ncbi:hypothetical protein Cgig2_003486 [Carnegiea gigantea]|uniref:Protein FAR1-RELATED SEQUENCE n=1 Tax=Carnegiea gigantea TaxID=171969 RepID=A0A9Q1QFZ2_9CARY|nr:hypothetical protein Cgig2_003486 [Carnegiea gigantea]
MPHEMHLLPCNRVITPEDEEKILLYKGVGLSVRQIIRVMELEKRQIIQVMELEKRSNMMVFHSLKRISVICSQRKSPKTIITDQDPRMYEAIASEMPATKHSYCIWHITSKFSGWFRALLRKFEHNWPLTVKKYNLQNNKHVTGLYQIRNFWAPAYLLDYFFRGMTTTGRSESINAFIKRFISSHTSLMDFFK